MDSNTENPERPARTQETLEAQRAYLLAHIPEIERKIGYSFHDKELLCKVFTANGRQRLRILGDSVTKLILASDQYRKHPHKREGAMTKSLEVLQSREAMLKLCQITGLDHYITGGHALNRADQIETMRALFGAVFQDAASEKDQALLAVSRLVEKFYDALDMDKLLVARPVEVLHRLGKAMGRRFSIQYENHMNRGAHHIELIIKDIRSGQIIFKSPNPHVGHNKKDMVDAAAAEALQMLGASDIYAAAIQTAQTAATEALRSSLARESQER